MLRRIKCYRRVDIALESSSLGYFILFLVYIYEYSYGLRFSCKRESGPWKITLPIVSMSVMFRSLGSPGSNKGTGFWKLDTIKSIMEIKREKY